MATKQKTSAAAKVAKAPREKQSGDVLFDIATEVEHLTQAKAFSLVEELSENIEQTSFHLGGILARIQDKAQEDEAWLGGCGSFKELVTLQFGLHPRKAFYLISIYKNLVEKGIPWDVVKDLKWTKISILAPVLTAKNAAGWAKKGVTMTVDQIREAVKKQLAAGQGANVPEATPVVERMTFKVHPDQKEVIREGLDKCKAETHTEFDTVALTHVFTAYLGGAIQIVAEAPSQTLEAPAGGTPEPTEQLRALIILLGAEVTLKLFGEIYPEIEVAVTM